MDSIAYTYNGFMLWVQLWLLNALFHPSAIHHPRIASHISMFCSTDANLTNGSSDQIFGFSLHFCHISVFSSPKSGSSFSLAARRARAAVMEDQGYERSSSFVPFPAFTIAAT